MANATYAQTIDGKKIYAERAVRDENGKNISNTYAKLSDIPSVPVNAFIYTGVYQELIQTTTIVSGAFMAIPVPDNMPIGDMFCCLDATVELSGASVGEVGILHISRKYKRYIDGVYEGQVGDVSVGLTMVAGLNDGGAKGFVSLLVRADGTIGSTENYKVTDEWELMVSGGTISSAVGDTMTVRYHVRWIQGHKLSDTETMGTVRARWNS